MVDILVVFSKNRRGFKPLNLFLNFKLRVFFSSFFSFFFLIFFSYEEKRQGVFFFLFHFFICHIRKKKKTKKLTGFNTGAPVHITKIRSNRAFAAMSEKRIAGHIWFVKVAGQITRSSEVCVFLIRKATCTKYIKMSDELIINRRSQQLAKNESQVTSDSSRAQVKSQCRPKVVYSWLAKQPVYRNI